MGLDVSLSSTFFNSSFSCTARIIQWFSRKFQFVFMKKKFLICWWNEMNFNFLPFIDKKIYSTIFRKRILFLNFEIRCVFLRKWSKFKSGVKFLISYEIKYKSFMFHRSRLSCQQIFVFSQSFLFTGISSASADQALVYNKQHLYC